MTAGSPLREAAAAHRLLGAGEVIGKLVLTVPSLTAATCLWPR